MNELDEKGFGHVHHAAARGFIKSVERFINASEEQLELETGDELKSTPLLLAVMNNQLDTVQCLVELGAKVYVVDQNNHGVIEHCTFNQNVQIINYFIELNHEKLPVWKNLIRFLASESDEEAEAAARCLQTLTQPQEDGSANTNWEPAFQNGIIPTVTKVIKSGISDAAKIPTFHIVLNLLRKEEIREQFVTVSGMGAIIRHLKVNADMIIQVSYIIFILFLYYSNTTQ